MNKIAYMMKERNSMERVLSTIEKDKEGLQTRLLALSTTLMNCKKQNAEIDELLKKYFLKTRYELGSASEYQTWTPEQKQVELSKNAKN